jgi:streptogramin lyase
MKEKPSLRWALTLSIAVTGLALLLMGLQRDSLALAERNSVVLLTTAPQSSFLYYFDSISQTFVFTLPLQNGSIPYGVAVTGTNPTHVWVAEYGSDQIGHLVYTDAIHYAWKEYPVTTTANNAPFRITVNGNDVWFTERGANRVGRLNALNGYIDEFYGHGLSPNSGLADLDIAPDGTLWMTGQWSNRLIRLDVTSTYAFREYDKDALNGNPLPSGPDQVPTTYVVWFTAPTSHTLARMTPSYGNFVVPADFPPTNTPYDILFPPNTAYVWWSDLQGNIIGQMAYGTLSNFVYFPITRPAQLASESPNVLWFTQQDERGAVARMVYTTAADYHFYSYPLPTSGLQPTGIAVAGNRGVWSVAFAPSRVFLPVVLRH